jgi:hypothetical protein
MEFNLQFYQIYSISYEFMKFELYLEFELNNSEGKMKKGTVAVG